MTSAQVAGFSKVESLSLSFKEAETAKLRRKDYLNAYLETPFETNQIFLKNYEHPVSDPLSYKVFDVSADSSLLPEKDFDVGCVGYKVYQKKERKGIEFTDGDNSNTESSVLPDKISFESDRMELLNGALRNSLHRIYVRSAKSFSEPFTRLTVLPSNDSGLHRKTELTFAEDAVCTFVDELRDPLGKDAAGGFVSDIVDAHLLPGADVNFVSISSGKAQIAVNYRFELSEGARLRFAGWTGGNPYQRSRVTVTLKGDGSQADVFTGNFVDRGGRHDMLATVEHFGRNSVGLVIQNGVVRAASRLLLKGMMIIRKPAKGADSHLKQHALLLSSDSFANAIPGLEIETNELKAKHAASVSQPEEEQLFYLMSRGLNERQAVTTIAFGNLGSLLSNVADERLRDQLADEIMDTLMQ
ncbi:MAG: SufD family Fe-S cluster assembly protein [Conexivisphaerales archaeon]